MLQFTINLLIMASIAAIVASSLNLLIGYTGVFSIAHAIFYGVGAYATALVSLHWGSSLLLALVVALVSSGVLSVLLALPAARVTGEYFVVVSLAFALVASTVFAQWTPVTGGPAGLVGISRATLFGIGLNSNESYLVLSLALLALVTVILYVLIRHTPLGRSLQALRDDPLAAQALGKNPFRLRLTAVVISAALASTGGVVYAGYIAFVNADGFGEQGGVLFMAMVILGGAGTLSGPIIGAFFITLFPALLEFADLPSQAKGPLEQIIYGAALVLLMLVRPSGIAGIFSALSPGHWRRARAVAGADAGRQPVTGVPVPGEYTPTGGAA
ncbi:MAG: Amino acid/amide transporter rane protein 2, family [Frankiales bacterium]|nr:Amino acid/amide transporter rane protein 2, family [Frankiales bacterium]